MRLRDYDAAATVSQRQAALHRVHESLGSLENGNKSRPWSPSWELQAAVNDLFNQPNLDVAIDVNTVSPLFNANLVETGPVFRKGYWSQVTAGPKTGFGLLPSDDGIAFYNKQSLVSVTPITDFQNQIAADDQGRRAAKLYQFSATTYDWSELTITTVLRSSGLTITPSSTHNIDAAICVGPDRRRRAGTRHCRPDRPRPGRNHAEGQGRGHASFSAADSRRGPGRGARAHRPARPRNAMPTCARRAWSAITPWPSAIS